MGNDLMNGMMDQGHAMGNDFINGANQAMDQGRNMANNFMNGMMDQGRAMGNDLMNGANSMMGAMNNQYNSMNPSMQMNMNAGPMNRQAFSNHHDAYRD